MLLLVLVPAPAAADQYVGGIPLGTVKEDTVSGGLWSDSYTDFANSAEKTFALPAYTEIKWARLYVSVYCAHMQNNYEHRATVKFDGGSGIETLGVEELRQPYVFAIHGGSPVWVNDHCNRITSDYLMWYDVTGRITARNPVAEVKVDQPEGYKGTFDGRIKLVTLVVAYDDGDGDEVYYWVNQGHDVHSYYVEDIGETYTGETTFDTEDLPEDDERVPAAEFSAIYMASNVGEFEFNTEPLDANDPQGPYSGYQTWDVSDLMEPGAASTFAYTRDLSVSGSGGAYLGAFFKIPLALLSVRYPEKEVGSINVTSAPAGAAIFLDDEPTQWTANTTIPGIPAGDHAVRVELDRYRVPEDQWVTVTKGSNATAHFDLEPITGSIEVTSEPAGAWIYLNGENMSVVTPATLENLIIGDYTVEVRAEGVEDYRTVTVNDGETTTVDFTLETAVGSDGRVPDYGYSGKTLDVAVSGTLHGNLTYYEFSDYTGLIHAGESREFTIDVPGNGTVAYARLYIYTTWGHDEQRKEGTPVRVSLAVDGATIKADAVYNDRKNEGIYNYLLETHAFNVTGVPGGIAGEHVVKLTNDGRKDDVFATYGIGLLVVTEDPAEPEMTYWVAEGSDTLYAHPDFGTTSEDCITTATFNESVDLSGAGEARLILVTTAGSGIDDDEHRIYFNDGEWFNLLTAGSSAISVADLDVRPYLMGSENAAGIQSLITTTKGDYMENRAIILVVRKGTPPEGYETNATSTTGTTGIPATPSSESGSRFTLNATNGRIEATRLVADGGAVQLYIPEGAVITEGSGSPVQALTLQRLLPGDAGGADPAYAVGSEDMMSDLPLSLIISVSEPGGVIARYDRSSGAWQTLETAADATGGSVSVKVRQGGIYTVRYGETGESARDGGVIGLLFGAVQALFGLFGFASAGEEPGPAVGPEPIPAAAAEPTPTAAPPVDITTMQFDLAVLSDPPGALIDLDGEYTGRTTPAAFASLSGGNHTVRVRMDGAEPVEREVQLARDDEVVVEVPGAVSPGLLRDWEQNHYGGVYVDSFPDEAEIFVDGRKVTQKTPAVIYGLKEGLHTIKVKKEKVEFSSDKERVWIDKNTLTRVMFSSGNAELTRSITFAPEEYAQKPFSINGRYMGDRFPKTIEVRGIGGAYLTVADGGGYRTYRIPATVQSNDTVSAAFSAAPCSLLVTSAPAGAAISVDGFQTGFATPYVVGNISEGRHLVGVSKPGYLPAEQEVVLTGGSGDAAVKFTLAAYTWGSLEVSSDPAGAKIYLFNRDTGEKTPHTFHYLGIGSYPVKVAGKEGSKTTEDVTIVPYSTTEYHADLTGA
ncbi:MULTISPECIES: DUF3344 domain-containing protein [unclassified Methanoculleus]|uniref:DUF3344 domain-containing protein n=1 Tax=unclassified Methanoculleus TaxID=2619537 RepID=UPI00319D947E